MPYNVLLIPLIGGYYFLSNFDFFKYKYQRVSSQRLIFNSALAGIFVGAISFVFRIGFEKSCPLIFGHVSQILSQVYTGSQRYIWTMLLGLMIVITLTHLSNLIIRKIPQIKGLPIRKAIKNYGNELEQLCLGSIDKGFALQITSPPLLVLFTNRRDSDVGLHIIQSLFTKAIGVFSCHSGVMNENDLSCLKDIQ